MTKIATGYLGDIYQVKKFTKLVLKVTKEIKKFHKKQPFDAIAFTGTSGAALAYPLSAKLGIPLICIRRGQNHFKEAIEGFVGAKTYIIIDDFIETGATIDRIIKKVKTNSKAIPVAIFLYTAKGTLNTKTWNDIPVIRIK
mgnify:CR=1 FL=1